MNDHVALALLLTLLAGLSTGIGSLIAFACRRTNRKFLSLALGFSGREEMDRFARQEGGQTAALLERACSQVEEETLQAVYRRDTSSGARFILQSSFGYGEKASHEPGPITVRVEGEEG